MTDTLPLLLALALSVATGCSASRPERDAAPPPRAAPVAVVDHPDAPDVDPSALARALHVAVNAARQREGLRAVAWSDSLARTAQAHSADMAARAYLAHVSPDGDDPNVRAARIGIVCRLAIDERQTRHGVLENLAQVWLYSSIRETTRGGRTATTYDWLTADALVARTVQGWLDSPTHRVNLLDALVTREGLGVARRPDGALYITQVLC